MGPNIPEEVNVFKIPHRRMKGLVDDYSTMMAGTNFMSRHSMDHLLATLEQTFREFVTHEHIENTLIMRRLQQKMAVKRLACNDRVRDNHENSQLRSILRLIRDGFRSRSNESLESYGRALRLRLNDFSTEFIPHMQQEEEEFQPLLQEVFTYEELCDLKRLVMEEHLLSSCKPASLSERIKPDFETSGSSDDECSESRRPCPTSSSSRRQSPPPCPSLPDELLLQVFRKLDARELCRARRVCKSWSRVAATADLFEFIQPVEWSKGNWDRWQDATTLHNSNTPTPSPRNDLSDVDSASNTQSDSESLIIRSLVKYFLPSVGHKVKVLNFSNSQYLSNGILHRILQFCPNVECIYIDNTMIGDNAFKSVIRKGSCINLRRISFSGCSNLTDITLRCISTGMKHLDSHESHLHSQPRPQPQSQPQSQLQYVNISGCYLVTDNGLSSLMSTYHPKLTTVDLSGLGALTVTSLRLLVSRCSSLRPELLWFCDSIDTSDHGFLSSANGCNSFECMVRYCCRQSFGDSY